jgi:hypothetical protein
LRWLGLASPRELREHWFSKPKDLMSLVADIEFVEPSRPDECRGFGEGTFCVFEPAVSAKMGYHKVIAEKGELPASKTAMMKAAGTILSHPRLYRLAVLSAALALRHVPHFTVGSAPAACHSSVPSTRGGRPPRNLLAQLRRHGLSIRFQL